MDPDLRLVFPSFPRCSGPGYSQVTDYVWDAVSVQNQITAAASRPVLRLWFGTAGAAPAPQGAPPGHHPP